MENYQLVTLSLLQKEAFSELEAAKAASQDFLCDGIEEFLMEEETVDRILGARSYSGGDLPLEILEEVEERYEREGEGIQLKFYFWQGPYRDHAIAFCQYLEDNFSGPAWKWETEEKHHEDWNEEWKKHYSPIRISPLLEVIPSFEKESHSCTSEIPLYINPAMAFGTGGHETTFLCLQLLDLLYGQEGKGAFSGRSCLDFGCGSGILGIAAGKLGYSQVDLVDIDPSSLENSRENIALNFSEESPSPPFHLLLGKEEVPPSSRYHLVFANILENILLQERDFLLARKEAHGYMILSGLLREQVARVEAAFGLPVISKVFKGDWGALLLGGA